MQPVRPHCAQSRSAGSALSPQHSTPARETQRGSTRHYDEGLSSRSAGGSLGNWVPIVHIKTTAGVAFPFLIKMCRLPFSGAKKTAVPSSTQPSHLSYPLATDMSQSGPSLLQPATCHGADRAAHGQTTVKGSLED